jgi:hypothetical protein
MNDIQDTHLQSLRDDLESTIASRWSPTVSLSVLACVIGSAFVLSFSILCTPVFRYPNLPELGISPKPELVEKHHAAQYEFQTHNNALNFALIGCCYAIPFGFLTSIRNRVVVALITGLATGIVGGIAGYLAGWFIAGETIASNDQSLVVSALLHAAVWVPIALGLSVTANYMNGNRKNTIGAVVVGVLSGLAVAFAYNVLFSALFSGVNLLSLIPVGTFERVVWCLGCSIVLGLGIAMGLQLETKVPAANESNVNGQ